MASGTSPEDAQVEAPACAVLDQGAGLQQGRQPLLQEEGVASRPFAHGFDDLFGGLPAKQGPDQVALGVPGEGGQLELAPEVRTSELGRPRGPSRRGRARAAG